MKILLMATILMVHVQNTYCMNQPTIWQTKQQSDELLEKYNTSTCKDKDFLSNQNNCKGVVHCYDRNQKRFFSYT